MHLPVSEYRLCEPPERWEDVTRECTASQMQVYHGDLAVHPYASSYRLRKVQVIVCSNPEKQLFPVNGPDQWAFLVERKVQP
jgi:hypothetical protein